MVGLYIGKDVAVVGDRHADTVHNHVGDLIALAGGDGKGLVRALVHRYAAGGSDAAAFARRRGDGVGLRLRIRLPAGCPEGNGNGVVLLHAGKGVPVAGKLVQHAGIVHNHLGDLIAFVRGDGEGLACALLHRYGAGGGNAAAFARRRSDGVGLRLRLPAAGRPEGDGNGVVGLYVGKGVAVPGELPQHAGTVHQYIGDLIALVQGDGEGLVCALVHRYAAGGSNAAAFACRCGDGVGLRLRLPAGRLEGDGNGVVPLHIGKGVAVVDKLILHAGTVHLHVGDLIALVRGDGEDLIRALVHFYLAGGINAAARTRRRGDGVDLRLIFHENSCQGMICRSDKGIAGISTDRRTIFRPVDEVVASVGSGRDGDIRPLCNGSAAAHGSAVRRISIDGDGHGLLFRAGEGDGDVVILVVLSAGHRDSDGVGLILHDAAAAGVVQDAASDAHIDKVSTDGIAVVGPVGDGGQGHFAGGAR